MSTANHSPSPDFRSPHSLTLRNEFATFLWVIVLRLIFWRSWTRKPRNFARNNRCAIWLHTAIKAPPTLAPHSPAKEPPALLCKRYFPNQLYRQEFQNQTLRP